MNDVISNYYSKVSALSTLPCHGVILPFHCRRTVFLLLITCTCFSDRSDFWKSVCDFSVVTLHPCIWFIPRDLAATISYQNLPNDGIRWCTKHFSVSWCCFLKHSRGRPKCWSHITLSVSCLFKRCYKNTSVCECVCGFNPRFLICAISVWTQLNLLNFLFHLKHLALCQTKSRVAFTHSPDCKSIPTPLYTTPVP